MMGRMTGRMDGKEDHHHCNRTKPRILYIKIQPSLIISAINEKVEMNNVLCESEQ